MCLKKGGQPRRGFEDKRNLRGKPKHTVRRLKAERGGGWGRNNGFQGVPRKRGVLGWKGNESKTMNKTYLKPKNSRGRKDKGT